MPLYFDTPESNENLSNQTTLTEMPANDFKKIFDEPQLTLFQRILRFFFFIIFLGPIKLICFLISILLIILCIEFLLLFKFLFKNEVTFKRFGLKVIYPFVRLSLFSLGVIKIFKRGSVNPETKILVSNHMSLFDVFAIFCQTPCSFVAADFLQKWKFIQVTRLLFDYIFVNRSIRGSLAEEIQRFSSDPNHFPLLMFPEGKVNDGSIVIGFRTGAFVSKEVVQLVSIRFRHWLIPKGIATICWISNKKFDYFYQLFAIPFYTVHIDFFPVFEWSSKDPASKAEEAQLRIANHLGVKALKNSNKEIFLTS